jgi:hypothetical protein
MNVELHLGPDEDANGDSSNDSPPSGIGKVLMAKIVAEKALSAELARADVLARDAWRFLAGIILVMGFQLHDIRSLVESPLPSVRILCCSSLAVLGVALILAVYNLQAKRYSHYPRGNRLWDNLKPESITEPAAEEALMQMILQTRELNARLNDTKERVSRWCGWLFLTGTLLVVGCQVLDAFDNWT